MKHGRFGRIDEGFWSAFMARQRQREPAMKARIDYTKVPEALRGTDITDSGILARFPPSLGFCDGFATVDLRGHCIARGSSLESDKYKVGA
jgi:hypothetical protein